MTIEEAARTLAAMYADAPRDEKLVSIHLFGIRHASDLDGMPVGDVVARSGLPISYRTEVRKGIRLARYVRPIG